MKYVATFNGKRKNADGISYQITTTVEGDNKDEARINLYDRFDHIIGLKLEEINNESNTATQG